MQTPLELIFKGMNHDETIKALVEEKIAKLDKICDHIISCHTAIEQIPNTQKKGHSYHVRVDLKIPPHHEIVVIREPQKGSFNHDPLAKVVRGAFDVVKTQVLKLVEKQHKKYKIHSKANVKAQILKEQGVDILQESLENDEVL